MSWTLPALLGASGGELLQWGGGPFRAVSTDSRTLAAGAVFLPLSGPHYDGHDFVARAIAGGATGVVLGRELSVDAGIASVLVGDTLRALGDLAAAWRRAARTRIVAVTGSNGKTTTKEMIAAVLAASGASVAKSRANENNLVGLPQTILGLTGEEDYAVLEMGMNHAGEIWRLAEIAHPEVGVITNVGPAHLEGLGSLSAVAAAKGELALAMPASGTLVVDGADSRLAAIARSFSGRALLAGTAGPVRVLATTPGDARTQNVRLDVAGRAVSIRLRALGPHNVTNAVLAATAAVALDVEAAAIATGLEAFSPAPMRLEVVTLASGARIWNDAYNANPASVQAALVSLAAEPARRRIAVLGEMWELGTEAARYHREAGRMAAEQGVDLLVGVGRFAEAMAAGGREGGLETAQIRRCDTPAAAAEIIAGELVDGVVVLVKGSRGARMEEVLRGLEGAE